jgi:hypothetical protein
MMPTLSYTVPSKGLLASVPWHIYLLTMKQFFSRHTYNLLQVDTFRTLVVKHLIS